MWEKNISFLSTLRGCGNEIIRYVTSGNASSLFFKRCVCFYWCCRDDLSFFRKGASKICRQQDLFSTLASIPGEPTIVVAHSLGAQVPGQWWDLDLHFLGAQWIDCSFQNPSRRFAEAVMISPQSDSHGIPPNEGFFGYCFFHLSLKMDIFCSEVPGSLSFVFLSEGSLKSFGHRQILAVKHLLPLSCWECSMRSDHL